MPGVWDKARLFTSTGLSHFAARPGAGIVRTMVEAARLDHGFGSLFFPGFECSPAFEKLPYSLLMPNPTHHGMQDVTADCAVLTFRSLADGLCFFKSAADE
jgi:hypothetical protein